MNPRTVLLLVVVGGGLLVWGTWPSPAPPAADTRPALAEASGDVRTAAAPAAVETASVAAPAPGLQVISGAAPTPLPAPGANLAQHYDELAQRARNGDAKAALRLYRDLSSCERFSGAQRGMQWLRERIDNPQLSERRRARAERRLAQYSQIACLEQQLCGQLSTAQRRDPTQWLVQAAVSGDADARIAFASGNFLSEGQLDALEYLPVYRAQALAMLETGLAQGHPAALRLAAFAFGASDAERSRLPLAQLVTHDPQRAQTYLEALRLALPGNAGMGGRRPIPDQRSVLTPAQQAQASAQAREVYERQLAGIDDLGAEMRRYREATAQFGELPDAAEIAEMAPQCR